MSKSSKIFKYVGKRLLQGVPIIIAIVVINFFLLNLAEGDAVDVLAGEAGSATPEYMEQLRKRFGLDQPLPVQLMVYLKNVLTLDLGYSFRHEMPVNALIFDRFAATGLLMTSTIILAVGFGILLGLLAAMRLNTWKDNVITIFALITYATPLFWVGLMMIMVFAVMLGWLPSTGRGETVMVGGMELSFLTLDGLSHLLMPALNLSLFKMSLVIRLARAGTREVVHQDYMKFARAKGLSESRLIMVHLLKNIMIPVVTVLGLELGGLIAFSVVTETVFAWPGMGKLIIDSIHLLDRPVVVAYLMIIVLMFVVINLVVDVLYSILDPRVRLQDVQS